MYTGEASNLHHSPFHSSTTQSQDSPIIGSAKISNISLPHFPSLASSSNAQMDFESPLVNNDLHLMHTEQEYADIGNQFDASTSTSSDGQMINRRITQPLSEKRKMQNRAAQKSFRERRDRYLKDLEEKVSTQAEKDVVINARIRNLEAENAALRRLLSQSVLPPGSSLTTPEQSSSGLWPDSSVLDSGRPSSASSSEVDRFLGAQTAHAPMGDDNALLSRFPTSSPTSSQNAAIGLPTNFSSGSSDGRNQHYSIIEDLDAVDWRYAWAQLCTHPQYQQCDRDELWQDLRAKAKYCVDRPPAIDQEELRNLRNSIPQRAMARRQQQGIEGHQRLIDDPEVAPAQKIESKKAIAELQKHEISDSDLGSNTTPTASQQEAASAKQASTVEEATSGSA